MAAFLTLYYVIFSSMYCVFVVLHYVSLSCWIDYGYSQAYFVLFFWMLNVWPLS